MPPDIGGVGPGRAPSWGNGSRGGLRLGAAVGRGPVQVALLPLPFDLLRCVCEGGGREGWIGWGRNGVRYSARRLSATCIVAALTPMGGVAARGPGPCKDNELTPPRTGRSPRISALTAEMVPTKMATVERRLRRWVMVKCFNECLKL